MVTLSPFLVLFLYCHPSLVDGFFSLICFFTERLAFNSLGFPYKCGSHQLARVTRLPPGLGTPVVNQALSRGKWLLIQPNLLLDPVDFPHFPASWIFERMFAVFS